MIIKTEEKDGKVIVTFQEDKRNEFVREIGKDEFATLQEIGYDPNTKEEKEDTNCCCGEKDDCPAFDKPWELILSMTEDQTVELWEELIIPVRDILRKRKNAKPKNNNL